MRFGLWFFLALALSVPMGAQQQPARSTPASPAAGNSPGPGSDQGNNSDSPTQSAPVPPANSSGAASKGLPPNMPPPRSDRVNAAELGSAVGDSSSRDSEIDLSPPANDAKAHPDSSEAVADAEAKSLDNGVGEFHTWDPHKAAKDVEVGDFYFRRKNYRAAEDRYREALRYKENDAIATLRLAVCLEKLGIFDDALLEYHNYLSILPHGRDASEAEKAIARIKAETSGPR